MNDTKEVYFSEYCEKCEHKDKREAEDPCNDCLNAPWNLDSHKPLFFKEEE